MKWLFGFLFVLQACSTLDTSPFEKFSKSSLELNRATESVLVAATKQVREEEIETISVDSTSKLGPYYIVTQGRGWKLEHRPRYMEVSSAQFELKKMNHSFERYIELLLGLSGSKLTDPKNLVSSVNKINHPEYSIVSTAALKSFEVFMRTKKEKHLRKAIKLNQEQVSAFSKSAVGLVSLINEIYRKSYVRSFTAYSKKWKDGNRADVLRKVFDLNDSFIQDIGGFQNIISAYEQLPEQHLNLGSRKPDKSMISMFKDLADEIKSTQKMKSEIEAEKK